MAASDGERRLSCAESASECEPNDAVRRRWGMESYEQAECCRTHPELRSLVEGVAERFRRHNVTAFLCGGSLLGQVRHGGRQIPWETDADFAFFPYDPFGRRGAPSSLEEVWTAAREVVRRVFLPRHALRGAPTGLRLFHALGP